MSKERDKLVRAVENAQRKRDEARRKWDEEYSKRNEAYRKWEEAQLALQKYDEAHGEDK